MNRSHEARLERGSGWLSAEESDSAPFVLARAFEGSQQALLPSSRYGLKPLPEHSPGIHSQLSRWGDGGLGCQYHRANQGQSQARTLTACFPACSAQPSGRHGGLGARASSRSGSSSAGNSLCGLQMPSSVWVAEMGTTPLSVALPKRVK